MACYLKCNVVYIRVFVCAFLFVESIGHSSQAQIKIISFSGYKTPDSSFWYAKFYKPNLKRSNLKDLTHSSEALHFRITLTEIQVLDIWTNDFKIFHGQIINWAETSGFKPEKFYSNIIPISREEALQVYQLFEKYDIKNIPTRSKVYSWTQGYDGNEFLIEYATKNNYSFKEYWEPQAYPKLKEAVAINSLVKELQLSLNLRRKWRAFVDILPPNNYHAGGEMITLPNLNKEDVHD